MNIFCEELSENLNTLAIVDEQVHHFKNVLRGKAGDTVQVFNGQGLIAQAIVLDISKKSLNLKIESTVLHSRVSLPTLILGVPKKEYVESALRTAVQVGVSHVIFAQTKFSPWVFKDSPRLKKIIISAITQSENPWFPTIEVKPNLSFLEDMEGPVLILSTEVKEVEGKKTSPKALFIGPEGGFHEDEIQYFRSLDQAHFLRFQTPILKAETAVPYGIGYVCGQWSLT